MTIQPEDKIRWILRDISALMYEASRKLVSPGAQLNPKVNKEVSLALIKASIKLNCLQCLWVEDPDVMLRPGEHEELPADFEFSSLFQMPDGYLKQLPTWHPYHTMRPYPKKTQPIPGQTKEAGDEPPDA